MVRAGGGNGLSASSTLVAGQTLLAPQVTTNSNNASTFEPYNPSDITGPNAPSLPNIPPPPKAHEACGALSELISVVVNAVVTYFSGSEELGAAAGNAAGQYSQLMLNGQFDWGRWLTFTANPFAGNASDFARTIYDPLNNGAPGKVNYGSIAISAAAAYVSEGVTEYVGDAVDSIPTGDAAGAVAGYATNYGLTAATGGNAHFSWARSQPLRPLRTSVPR